MNGITFLPDGVWEHSAALQGACTLKSVDPKTIRFSMPTVAADALQFVVPSRQSFEGAPQFHEDEWRQLEFYPSFRIDALKLLLIEFKTFEEKHRTEHGWTDIYARGVPGPGLFVGADAHLSLAAWLPAAVRPSPILTTSSASLGQVKNGYTLRLSDSVFLYGIADGSGVASLAAMVERGGDDALLTATFAKLYAECELVLIDWRSQMLLTSVEPSGQITIWRP